LFAFAKLEEDERQDGEQEGEAPYYIYVAVVLLELTEKVEECKEAKKNYYWKPEIDCFGSSQQIH
jgi:hypothetical protein